MIAWAIGCFALINSFTGFGSTFTMYDLSHNAFEFNHIHVQSCIGIGCKEGIIPKSSFWGHKSFYCMLI